MKPRLRIILGTWSCFSGDVCEFGKTPLAAYSAWWLRLTLRSQRWQ